MSDAMTPTITQADRDAAARLAALAELRPMLLSGSHDDHPYIQVFATHRELGAREERARVVAWLKGLHWTALNKQAAEMFGDAIEHGVHSAKG